MPLEINTLGSMPHGINATKFKPPNRLGKTANKNIKTFFAYIIGYMDGPLVVAHKDV